MSPPPLGGASHCAPLFPLPLLAAPPRPPSLSSAHTRRRYRVRCAIHAAAARCIAALNRMYDSRLAAAAPLPFGAASHARIVEPDDHSSHFRWATATPSSRAQLRAVAHIMDHCAAWVLEARVWRPHGPERDTGALVSALTSPPPPPPTRTSTAPSPTPAAASAPVAHAAGRGPAPYFVDSPVVPLVADRVSLPEHLRPVPMLSVLPPDVAAAYSPASAERLMRPLTEVFALHFARHLRRPRVAGSRAEYVRLISRLMRLGMVGFTDSPLAVNGVFTVSKDDSSDRLIIDAQPANRLFVDPPPVSLPDPSHLVQLQVPAGCALFVGKSDLSNFYHHFGLPAWMQPFFALPPLTPAERASCGLPPHSGAFPMCLTMPMGWSHSVAIAQTAHEHMLYSTGALQPGDSIVRMQSPQVTAARALHGIEIDDFFLFSLSQSLAEAQLDRVLRAYAAFGFVVKQSKVVRPTSVPVKVLGLSIDGARARIALPVDSQAALVRGTQAALCADVVTGISLSRLLGHWTWVLLLRRPALAALQHVYRYCETARWRRFTLWPSVRRELETLLALLPLLTADLAAPCFHRAFASDASEEAAGVVSTALTPQLQSSLWPLCSARRHATAQCLLAGAARASQSPQPAQRALTPPPPPAGLDTYYSAVRSAPWRVDISHRWSAAEHINALELRGALLACHRALSYPSSISSRVFLLLDSAVAYFTLWKGRSSSPALLRIVRKVSALLLCSGVALQLGWLPSERNPADAPSRPRQTNHDAAGA